MTLSCCSHSQIVRSIDNNLDELNRQPIHPIKWLAYPKDLARYVNIYVKDWLDNNPDHFNVFAGAGVNNSLPRNQWRHISAINQDITIFKKLIQFNAYCTEKEVF